MAATYMTSTDAAQYAASMILWATYIDPLRKARTLVLDCAFTDIMFLLDINAVSEIIMSAPNSVIPSTVHRTIKIMIDKAASFARNRDMQACLTQIDETLAFIDSYICNYAPGVTQ